LDVKIKDVNNKDKDFEDEYTVVAIDSTRYQGYEQMSRWMGDKWNICNNKKGYLKIHVAINVKTKKILSIKVTGDEHVHDSKALPELVENLKIR
jgi:hypothetical protein